MEKGTSAQDLAQKREQLTHVIDQRRALIDKIGTGDVQLGSSWENTLRVGRVREKVFDSVQRHEEQRRIITAQEELLRYQENLSLRREQLTEMRRLQQDGYLPDSVVDRYQQEYASLVMLPETSEPLRRGLDLQGEPHEQESSSATVPEYALPNGRVVVGRSAEILSALNETTAENPLSIDAVVQQIYPGVDKRVAVKRLKAQLTYARNLLDRQGETSLEIISEFSPDNGSVLYIKRG